MCGRFALTATIEQIKEHFSIDHSSNAVIVPRYNIAPNQVLLTVQNHKLEFYNWGIQLPIANRSYVINAKIETILAKKLFNWAFKKQRCLIVGSGFFEWKIIGNKKVPYYIQIKDQNVLGFAGIIVNNNCVILTTAADPTKYPGAFHQRFPVVINKHKYSLWLDPKAATVDLTNPELQVSGTDFTMYPVSPQVNNPKLDNIVCIKSLIS